GSAPPSRPGRRRATAALEAGTPDGDRFASALPRLRADVLAETGVPIPPIRVRAGVSGLPVGGYRILLHDVPHGAGRAPDASVLCFAPEDVVARLAPGAARAETPWTRRAAFWVPRGSAETLGRAGLTALEPQDAILDHLRAVLARCASQFIGHQETQDLLDRLEKLSPALVRAATPKPLPLDRIAGLLKLLAEEHVPIRDLRRILESAIAHAAERDPYALLDRVRADLKRQVTAALLCGRETLGVLLVAPEVEDVLRESIKDLGDGPRMLLDPETAESLVRSAAGEAARLAPDAGPPVVLTQPEIRRHLWRLLDLDIPDVRVVSYRELDPSTRIEPVGRISVGKLG
ncbi:MAG: FHIPEP family type III secretion protein, partial [Myxococcota bacterium]|nr:FHIPEP family type III secretion protein [Myxococcota bacterium]